MRLCERARRLAPQGEGYSAQMSESGNSTGDLLDALRDDLRELVRQELRNAQDELQAKARQVGRSAAMLGAAGLLGALAAGTGTTLLVRVLDRVLPPAAAALVATAMLGGGAAGLAVVGLQDLRNAWPDVRDETLGRMQGDVHAARVAAEHS